MTDTIYMAIIALALAVAPAQAQQVFSKAFAAVPVPCDGNEYSTSADGAWTGAGVNSGRYFSSWESGDIFITEVDLCLVVQGNPAAGYWYAMVGESGPDGDPLSGYIASPDVCGKFPLLAGQWQRFQAAGGFHIDAHVWCTGSSNAAARFVIRYTKVPPQ